ncbi:Na+/H+ antiporter subunit E [Pseudokineococcus sp. 1T1Z-3]|uniref:Na+/H+ antiporter subunit E n=1 Tax=Pseudokineococcus sp. 1T1Z-3 TaxID=3132745 RepID=UPI0030989F6D
MRGPVGRAVGLVAFGGWYAGQFLVANVQVLGAVLSPRLTISPAAIRVSSRARTDVELATFIALVGLTPGTMVVGSQDRRDEGGSPLLDVHVIDAADAHERVEQLETRLLAALRGTRATTTDAAS